MRFPTNQTEIGCTIPSIKGHTCLKWSLKQEADELVVFFLFLTVLLHVHETLQNPDRKTGNSFTSLSMLFFEGRGALLARSVSCQPVSAPHIFPKILFALEERGKIDSFYNNKIMVKIISIFFFVMSLQRVKPGTHRTIIGRI